MNIAGEPLQQHLARTRSDSRAVADATSKAIGVSEGHLEMLMGLCEQQSIFLQAARTLVDHAALPRDVPAVPDVVQLMR